MPLSDFDTQIQCEEYYDEPDYWNADYSHIPIDEWESDHFDPDYDPDVVWDDDDEGDWVHDIEEEDDESWVRHDGSTGPAGEAFLASLTPEDFV